MQTIDDRGPRIAQKAAESLDLMGALHVMAELGWKAKLREVPFEERALAKAGRERLAKNLTQHITRTLRRWGRRHASPSTAA